MKALKILAAWEALMFVIALPIWWCTVGESQAAQIAEGFAPIPPAFHALVSAIAARVASYG